MATKGNFRSALLKLSVSVSTCWLYDLLIIHCLLSIYFACHAFILLVICSAR